MTPVDGQNANLVGRTLGVYRLEALLGAGGMAEVYRALDTKLQREVAVKVLPASLALDPGYVERFRSEGRQVAALNHPHIVPVYQFGEEGGLLFLVMPVLKESLRDRLDREHRLTPSEATRLAVQIASALDAAHARGLVHRDVKPENILLNEEGRALLTDFGIAREVAFLRETGAARTLAASGLPVGTPEYMAPEQLRGLPVDQRADVYALGAVLYELLTGLVPHDAATPYEVAALVLTAPTTPPSTHNPQIWPELDAVVLRALAKTPEQRFADARSFALALRQVVVDRGRPTAGAIPSVHWTQYAPPLGSANVLAASAVAGGLMDMSAGVLAPPSVGSPTLDEELTHPPLRSQDATGFADTPTRTSMAGLGAMTLADGASVVGGYGGYGADVVGGSTGAGWGRPTQPRRGRGAVWLLLTAGLLLAIALGVLGAGLLGNFNPFGSGGPSAPFGASGPGGSTSGQSTRATNGTPGRGVAATATAHSQGTATTSPQATATATATATQSLAALEVSPTPLNLQSRPGHTCQGTVMLSNINSQTVGWSWTDISPQPSQFQYQFQPGPWSNGYPADPALVGGQSDNLTVKMHCQDNQQYVATFNETVNGSVYATHTLTMVTGN